MGCATAVHAEAHARTPLTPAQAWDRLADLAALSQWAPDVADSPADPLRPGAVRRARLKKPAYGKEVLVERFTQVDARQRTFTYDIEGGIGPLASIRTTWSVAGAADGGSVVKVASEVTLSGAARFVPFLVKRAWTKQLQELVDGFVGWAGKGRSKGK
jgi:hypothetical protein